MQDIGKVKDRIRKLLNLARDDAAAEGEVDNALRFAKEMMDQHHLQEEDLVEEPEDQYKKIQDAPKSRNYVSIGGHVHVWESLLSSFCANFVGGVGCYLDPSKQIARDHRGMFIPGADGEPFHELRMTIIAMGKLKFGGAFRGDGGAYSEGFVSGLYTKIQEQERQAKLTQNFSSTALVLIERRKDLVQKKHEIAQKWIREELGLSFVNGQKSCGSRGSSEARNEGYSDGKSSDVKVSRSLKIK